MSRFTAAIAYARHGWPVFPCKPGLKVPATRNGFKDATTDPRQIEAWWNKSDFNIGVPTGTESGLFVLDVDGEDGIDSVVELNHGVPGTLTQSTPSGGYHFFFQWPGVDIGNSARKIAPNTDTRGRGGYVLVSPSETERGTYRWAARQDPSPIPGWLLRLVREPPAKPKPAPKVDSGDAGKYAAAALERECEEVARTPQGNRNPRLNQAAFSLGTLVGARLLDGETVHASLLAAAAACGLGESEARKTIASGLSSGIKHPREVAA